MNNDFAKNSLLPEEKIFATASFHPIRYMIPIVIAILVWIIGASYPFSDKLGQSPFYYGSRTTVFEAIFGVTDYNSNGFPEKVLPQSTLIILIIVPIILVALAIWSYLKNEFVITNIRVIAKSGIIRRVSFELYNERVESIEVSQGYIGRLLNYGTLMPCGIGASRVRIPFVKDPFLFRQYFYDLQKGECPLSENDTTNNTKKHLSINDLKPGKIWIKIIVLLLPLLLSPIIGLILFLILFLVKRKAKEPDVIKSYGLWTLVGVVLGMLLVVVEIIMGVV